jgi:polyphosphate kinase
MESIQREMNFAKKGKSAAIVIKVNNLIDETIIKKLLDAAEAGVRISCIIRGVCLLQPSTKKQKKNIHMRSIIGRYLEHARLFVFNNGGDEVILFGSADLMTRNLDYRVEVTTPVYNPSLKAEIMAWLDIQLSDNTKARSLHSGEINTYICPLDAADLNDSQEVWKKYLEGKSAKV